MSNYDYNELRVLTHKTIKIMNSIELQEINKVIEVLTAYKEGKIIEFYTDENGWIKCVSAPCISIITTNIYRIVNEQENIETYEE